MTGRVHSVESCGTVDGPGIRFVLFLQGCPLRCRYCHNPDTWDPAGGRAVTVEALMAEIAGYESYMKYSGGGVTVSGGEPLLQPDFVAALFAACRARGIHTALDTSGCVPLALAEPALDQSDLVLLDFKSHDPAVFRQVTGAELAPTLAVAAYLAEKGIPVWARYVLVPGLTDAEEPIRALAGYLADLGNVEKAEVIPFHKMGEFKWKQLNLEYTLADIPPAHHRDVARVKDIFRNAGLTTD